MKAIINKVMVGGKVSFIKEGESTIRFQLLISKKGDLNYSKGHNLFVSCVMFQSVADKFRGKIKKDMFVILEGSLLSSNNDMSINVSSLSMEEESTVSPFLLNYVFVGGEVNYVYNGNGCKYFKVKSLKKFDDVYVEDKNVYINTVIFNPLADKIDLKDNLECLIIGRLSLNKQNKLIVLADKVSFSALKNQSEEVDKTSNKNDDTSRKNDVDNAKVDNDKVKEITFEDYCIASEALPF